MEDKHEAWGLRLKGLGLGDYRVFRFEFEGMVNHGLDTRSRSERGLKLGCEFLLLQAFVGCQKSRICDNPCCARG